jgi:hypothetical protein
MRLALLIVAMLWGACAVAFSQNAPYSLSDHPSQDGRCKGDAGVGDIDRSEKACLAQVADIAERHGGSLQLKFGNGNTRIYLDETAACDQGSFSKCIKYQLTGFFPRHGLLLIEQDYWEGVEWLLVQTQTGEAIKILAPPHYSPHEKWLVSVSGGIGSSGSGNGIDIVPTAFDRAQRRWHYRVPDEDDWLYEFAGWEGDERVKLTVSTFNQPKPLPARVDLVNGTWRLTPPNSTPQAARP